MADLSSEVDSTEEAIIRARLTHIEEKRRKRAAKAAAGVTRKEKAQQTPQSVKGKGPVDVAKPTDVRKDQRGGKKAKKKDEVKMPLEEVKAKDPVKSVAKSGAKKKGISEERKKTKDKKTGKDDKVGKEKKAQK